MSNLRDTTDTERQALSRTLRRPALVIVMVLLVFFGGFGVWSYYAPLAAASIAPGLVSPAGSHKVIQHLEGGIISAILVEDGDVVEPGQPLVVLQEIQALALHNMLTGQYQTLLAIESRLLAEQACDETITFPISLNTDNARIAEAVLTQRAIFDARRTALNGRHAILRQRIAQLEEEITGLQALIESEGRQIELIGEEIRGVGTLVHQGLERRPRLLALQREEAEISGRMAENQARIARARQVIGEAELQIIGLESDRQNEIADDLGSLRASRSELEERLVASDDVLRRTVIIAPIAGTVVELRFRTSYGVIGPGEPIMDIVPLTDDLIVEARVSPTDIDVVEVGLPAIVHLSAYKQRIMPRIDGVVSHVSADALTDPVTGERYFLAQIDVSRASLAMLDAEIELTPGMPAEAMILTGERTLFDYMVGPFLESFNRSFREN